MFYLNNCSYFISKLVWFWVDLIKYQIGVFTGQPLKLWMPMASIVSFYGKSLQQVFPSLAVNRVYMWPSASWRHLTGLGINVWASRSSKGWPRGRTLLHRNAPAWITTKGPAVCLRLELKDKEARRHYCCRKRQQLWGRRNHTKCAGT